MLSNIMQQIVLHTVQNNATDGTNAVQHTVQNNATDGPNAVQHNATERTTCCPK